MIVLRRLVSAQQVPKRLAWVLRIGGDRK
jgi:hypothetical protein